MTAMDDSGEVDAGTRRLWTPWRMQYVGGGTREAGCVFCNRLCADADVANLILYRAASCFVIMNLYPYNTGHVMIVPNAHVDSPETLDVLVLGEIANLLPIVLRASRRVLGCHGFNVGLNVGSVAGAGVAEHMHEHVVPRWNGDANFMPIIGSAMVIPELIPVTYAKLRAELAREIAGATTVTALVLDPDAGLVAPPMSDLPVSPSDPAWHTALRAAGPGASIAGWAGPARATGDRQPAITATVSAGNVPDLAWQTLDRARAAWPEFDRALLDRAIANLAQRIG